MAYELTNPSMKTKYMKNNKRSACSTGLKSHMQNGMNRSEDSLKNLEIEKKWYSSQLTTSRFCRSRSDYLDDQCSNASDWTARMNERSSRNYFEQPGVKEKGCIPNELDYQNHDTLYKYYLETWGLIEPTKTNLSGSLQGTIGLKVWLHDYMRLMVRTSRS